jgi:bacterioferritin-associated ferredoxin
MYACLCVGLKLKDAKELRERGMSLPELQDTTGASRDCGACRKLLTRVFEAGRDGVESKPDDDASL